MRALMLFYLLMRYRMTVSADYRRILRKEVKAYTIIQKSFAKQEKFLMENLEELYTKFPLNISIAFNYLNQTPTIYPKKNRKIEYTEEPLWWFRREMWIDEMIEQLQVQIWKWTEKWYKTTRRKFRKILEANWFVYSSDIISNYAKDRWELHLSNYRWVIWHTTKFDVIKVLKEWIDNNRTYTQVRDEIVKVNEKLFGKPRARTIAVTEMWKAYEYGNIQPMRQLQSVWVDILKQRQTCEDSKVRPEHMECENLGRVPLDFVYPLGVQYPPGWVNCRCTILYKVND